LAKGCLKRHNGANGPATGQFCRMPVGGLTIAE
jgi:hypothetical protein